MQRGFFIGGLTKNPEFTRVECRGVGTTPFHASERGQTARFVAESEPRFTEGYLLGKHFQKNGQIMID